LWSGIEVLQHDDFPYPFRAISSSSEASTKSGSPRMASSLAGFGEVPMVVIDCPFGQQVAESDLFESF
jgi:hypothetical protein